MSIPFVSSDFTFLSKVTLEQRAMSRASSWVYVPLKMTVMASSSTTPYEFFRTAPDHKKINHLRTKRVREVCVHYQQDKLNITYTTKVPLIIVLISDPV
jgi:hypothetical protein